MVRITKCRRKTLYGQLRKNLGEVLYELARQKESKVLEGHLHSDHVHMLVSIPQKYVVSQVIGYMKGKSAIHIARIEARSIDRKEKKFRVVYLDSDKKMSSAIIDSCKTGAHAIHPPFQVLI